MKLLRYGPAGQEKPGILDSEGLIRDLSGVIADLTPDAVADLGKLRGLDLAALPLVESDPRIGVPVKGIGKFIAIGLNYADHAREAGLEPPARADLLHQGDLLPHGAQ